MPRYYYASGERVPIEPDEAQVAVDVGRAGKSAMREIAKQAGSQATRGLSDRVVIIERSTLGTKRMAALEAAGAVQSVYRHEQAMLVPLPEVRVELDPGQRKKVLAALKKSPLPLQVTADGEERIVLRPDSGSGDDAISIANYLYEAAHPASASVNFLRFVARPDTVRRSS